MNCSLRRIFTHPKDMELLRPQDPTHDGFQRDDGSDCPVAPVPSTRNGSEFCETAARRGKQPYTERVFVRFAASHQARRRGGDSLAARATDSIAIAARAAPKSRSILAIVSW